MIGCSRQVPLEVSSSYTVSAKALPNAAGAACSGGDCAPDADGACVTTISCLPETRNSASIISAEVAFDFSSQVNVTLAFVD